MGGPLTSVSQWTQVDLYTYNQHSQTNKITFYEAVVDPLSVNIAAYNSIVRSYNYYLMGLNAQNGGDMEKGSYDGYTARLNTIMLGL